MPLVVAKFRDGAKHCVCGRSVMNPGSVSAVAERHGAEDDVSDRCFGHSNRLASLSMAAPERTLIVAIIEINCDGVSREPGRRIQRIVTMYKSGLVELEAVVGLARRGSVRAAVRDLGGSP